MVMPIADPSLKPLHSLSSSDIVISQDAAPSVGKVSNDSSLVQPILAAFGKENKLLFNSLWRTLCLKVAARLPPESHLLAKVSKIACICVYLHVRFKKCFEHFKNAFRLLGSRFCASKAGILAGSEACPTFFCACAVSLAFLLTTCCTVGSTGLSVVCFGRYCNVLMALCNCWLLIRVHSRCRFLSRAIRLTCPQLYPLSVLRVLKELCS
jgi:hypothetical protein